MNIKLIVVVILILVVFLLYKKLESKQEKFGSNMTRYIKIEGGGNFAMTEVEVIDASGINILKPYAIKDKKINPNESKVDNENWNKLIKTDLSGSINEFSYKNIFNKTVKIRQEEGGIWNDEQNENNGLKTIVDGIKYTNTYKYFFHAANEPKNSILIELEDSNSISKINIYPRMTTENGIKERMNNIKVTLIEPTLLNKNLDESILYSIQIPRPEYKLNNNNKPLPIVFDFEKKNKQPAPARV